MSGWGITLGWSWGGWDFVAQRTQKGQTWPHSSVPSSSGNARLSLRWSERTQAERRAVGLRERERKRDCFNCSFFLYPLFSSVCFDNTNAFHVMPIKQIEVDRLREGDRMRYTWHERNNKIEIKEQEKQKRIRGTTVFDFSIYLSILKICVVHLDSH